MIRLGPGAPDFVWATGIENTFVPQVKPGHRALDEYQLMQHYENWRADLSLVPVIGATAVRWGVPWYKVEPSPGVFDWRWTDEVIPFLVETLSLTPIVDLMHFGCPFWLRREFASLDYPAAVSDYARAFARRYSSLVKYYTPLNEPLVNALMCGKRGAWPPYLRGDSGYIRIMIQLARGIRSTIEALREVDPDCVIVHVEATGLSRAAREDLEILAAEEQRRGYLCFDLLTGRVGADHPLFGWLIRNGASVDDLSDLAKSPIAIDVMGMNFYPQWSTTQLYLDNKGRLAYRHAEEEGGGFARLIEDYFERYRRPIFITETSAHGPHDVRSRWLERSVHDIKILRSKGIPVVGYTWFPLFTMIDWRYRVGLGPVENYRIELGLYAGAGDGALTRWSETPLADQFRSYARDPVQSVGNIADPSPLVLASLRRLARGSLVESSPFEAGEGEGTAMSTGEAIVTKSSDTLPMHREPKVLSDGRSIYFYSFAP